MQDTEKTFETYECTTCHEPYENCNCSPSTCRGDACRADIWWVLTHNQKRMCLNKDATAHYPTCPDAPKFRNGKKDKPVATAAVAKKVAAPVAAVAQTREFPFATDELEGVPLATTALKIRFDPGEIDSETIAKLMSYMRGVVGVHRVVA